MEIFHYHHWTNHLEETEKFYVENGFHVAGRFARVRDGIKTYHPPLHWDDFREENPTFRIIEVRKGKVNVTFGAGKKTMFDHIGFLVTNEEHDDICTLAKQLGFNVSAGDRRTFIGTPSRLRIELQQRDDVVGGRWRLYYLHGDLCKGHSPYSGFYGVTWRICLRTSLYHGRPSSVKESNNRRRR